jgi:hypothetical protein
MPPPPRESVLPCRTESTSGNQHGFIIGRDDYNAVDDEQAMAVARAREKASSDLCTCIEVWSGIRRVDVAPLRAKNERSVGEIVAEIQSTLLERELALRDRRCQGAGAAPHIGESSAITRQQRASEARVAGLCARLTGTSAPTALASVQACISAEPRRGQSATPSISRRSASNFAVVSKSSTSARQP